MMIENFVKNMTISDLQQYCQKNKIEVSNKDLDTILYYIKNYWEQVYDGDTSIFDSMKNQLEPSSYATMISLYNTYKKYL